MRVTNVIFSLVAIAIFPACTSTNKDLQEALKQSSSIVEESIQFEQAMIAALHAENPVKMKRYYSFARLVERAHEVALIQLDSCNNSKQMLLIYNEFLAEVRNYPEDELGVQMQMNVHFQKLKELYDYEVMRLIIKSEMQNIEYRVLDELNNMISAPSYYHFYGGSSAYQKGDSTYVEVIRFTPLVLQENIKNMKVIRNEKDFKTEFTYRPIQEAKSIFVFKRLPPGEYEINAEAYFEHDHGWIDSQSVLCHFKIEN